MTAARATSGPPTFREALRVWLGVGLNSFGGPAGQIAVLHEELVERRAWISERRFLHALDLCMLLPGPEAQQLAVYCGWTLHGVRGGLAAGVLFVAPGAAAMLALCCLYVEVHDLAWFEALFAGIQSAVVALVLLAVARIARRALKRPAAWAIAAASFLATSAYGVRFPLVVLAALVAGIVLERASPGALRAPSPGHDASKAGVPTPTARRSLRTLAMGLALWLAPVVALVALDPGGGVQADMARFFTGAAVVTFGGAYAALAYTADHADGAWITSTQMADGLGLAESTPGPLVLVLQFVAFVGAHQNAGTLAPLGSAALASAAMLWTTFAPCFLWIFLLAPWMEALRANRALGAALAAVGAAVVGVIADLGAWFATHVLFRETHTKHVVGGNVEWPIWSSVDLLAVVVTACALFLLARAKWPIPAVIVACGLATGVARLAAASQ